MDHLPYPESAVLEPIQVPFLCEHIIATHELCRDDSVASGGGSSTSTIIPTSSEFFTWAGAHQDLFSPPAYCDEDLLGLVQAFCYFGLLKEFLDDEFRLADFLLQVDDERGKPQRTVITLRHLHSKILRVRQQKPEYRLAIEDYTSGDCPIDNYDRLKETHLRYRRYLSRAIRTADFLTTGVSEDLQEEVHLLRLSLEVLCWSLLKCLPLPADLLLSFKQLEYNGNLTYANPTLIKRLIKAGWCPYWSNRYIGPNSAPLLYYMSGMSQAGHELCSEAECVAQNIDKNTYKTQHTSEDCSCGLRGPDLARVRDIIAKGGIPILRLTRRPWRTSHPLEWLFQRTADEQRLGEDIKMEVVEATPGVSYFALSHVWADGLGNPRDNKIHSCQLRYLFDTLRRCPPVDYTPSRLRYDSQGHRHRWEESVLSARGLGFPSVPGLGSWDNPLRPYLAGPSVNIWIDTLCIPCSDEDEGLRKLAIHKMAMVYTLAEQVIVIDRTVSNLRFRESSDLYIAVRLLTSPWMTRCWTYQEACLARKFSFALQDKILSPGWWSRAPHPVPADRCKTAVEKRLKYECMAWFDDIPAIMTMAGGGNFDDFVEVAMVLILEPTFQMLEDHWYISDHAAGEQDIYEAKMQRRVEIARANAHRFDAVFSHSHTVTMEQTTDVWNNLAARATTKREDLHGILAALLGLSVKEVLDLTVDVRMKAVLKTMSRLPLMMFYGPYADNVDMASSPGSYPWVPLYPASALLWEKAVTESGRCEMGQYMAWTEEGNLLVSCHFPLQVTSLHFIVRGCVQLAPEMWLGHNIEDVDWVKVNMPNDFTGRVPPMKISILRKDGLPALDEAAPYGVLLSMQYKGDDFGIGAVFVLREPWKEELGGSPTVDYVGPIRFYRPDADSITSEDKLLPFVRVDAGMPHDFTFVINTDANTWPTLKYRRSSGDLLVNGSVSGVLRSIVVCVVWDTNVLCSLVWDLIFRPRGFRIWHLYPLALMKGFQVFSLFVEEQSQWVEREVMMARCDAIARTFDVGSDDEHHESDTGDEGDVGTTSSQDSKLFSASVLRVRAILGGACIVGSLFFARRGSGARRQLWRYGVAFLMEVSARIIVESLWKANGLDRMSTWIEVFQGLQEMNTEQKEENFANREVVRSRARKWKPVARRYLPWMMEGVEAAQPVGGPALIEAAES